MNNNPNNPKSRRDPRDNYINEEIVRLSGIDPRKPVRVIGKDGAPLGIISITDAQKRAYDDSLDLVLIDLKNDPAVCKIMDWGKFKFERDKKEKEARKNQKIVELKEIQFTPQIGEGDLETKINNARRFLADGNKVKLVIKYKGRQMAHQELGVAVLDKIKAACADLGAPEKAANLEGRNLLLFLAPNKK